MNTWLAYSQAKTWGCRPSELYDIEDPYVAFCFDQAVAAWGNHVVTELDDVEGKTKEQVEMKRNMKLNDLLGLQTPFAAPPNPRRVDG